MYIITTRRMISGLDLKYPNGERWVMAEGYAGASAGSSQVALTEPG